MLYKSHYIQYFIISLLCLHLWVIWDIWVERERERQTDRERGAEMMFTCCSCSHLFPALLHRGEERFDHLCVHSQRWRRRLLCRQAATLHGNVHHCWVQQGAQGGTATKQHIWSQAGGQEASDPDAGGHRSPVLSLLDAAVLCQHLEGFRWYLCQTSALWGTHRFHPLAVLHLCLR